MAKRKTGHHLPRKRSETWPQGCVKPLGKVTTETPFGYQLTLTKHCGKPICHPYSDRGKHADPHLCGEHLVEVRNKA